MPRFKQSPARNTDPHTAHEAAFANQAARSGQRITVFWYFANCIGALDYECSRDTGLLRTSVGKRRHELMIAGMIEDSGERRKTDTGSTAIVWCLTKEYRTKVQNKEEITIIMPRKTTPKTQSTPVPGNTQIEILAIPAVNKTAIVKARDLALAIIAEVTNVAANLVVETEEQYHAADEILHKIKVTEKRLDEPFENVIREPRQGLDRIYALRRTIANPLLDLEVAVKEKMRAYKLAESKRLDAEKAERDRKQKEADEAERLRIQANAPSVETQSEVVVLPVVPIAQPIRAASSSAIKVKKWRVVDFELLVQAVSLGMVPKEALMVDVRTVQATFNTKPDEVATYPGVEIYDDFSISGR